MPGKTNATIDDLYRVPENGKAELIDGVLVRMAPTGGRPSRAAGGWTEWTLWTVWTQRRRSLEPPSFPPRPQSPRRPPCPPGTTR